MKQAIRVFLIHKNNTIFIIEGFNQKTVNTELIQSKILEHFEYMYGVGNVEIRQVLKDFLVKTKDNECAISWSWIKSYIV
jgi:hypothetical protein